MTWSVFVHVEFLVVMIHAPGIKEDQYDEDVDGTLLSEPEAQPKPAYTYAVQLLDEQDPESVGADEPDDQAAEHEPQIRLPVGFSIFRRHRAPPAVASVVRRQSARA